MCSETSMKAPLQLLGSAGHTRDSTEPDVARVTCRTAPQVCCLNTIILPPPNELQLPRSRIRSVWYSAASYACIVFSAWISSIFFFSVMFFFVQHNASQLMSLHSEDYPLQKNRLRLSLCLLSLTFLKMNSDLITLWRMAGVTFTENVQYVSTCAIYPVRFDLHSFALWQINKDGGAVCSLVTLVIMASTFLFSLSIWLSSHCSLLFTHGSYRASGCWYLSLHKTVSVNIFILRSRIILLVRVEQTLAECFFFFFFTLELAETAPLQTEDYCLYMKH